MTEPWTSPPPPPPEPRAQPASHAAPRRGLAAGLVAAAAILGLLLGIGRRTGTAFRPLNATAYALIGTRADGVWGFDPNVTVIGVLVVLALSAVAGVVVAWLSPSHRTPRVLVAAAGVALLGYLFHVYVAARVDGGLSALLSNGELRALYVTLAGALVLGMRLAFSHHASARRN